MEKKQVPATESQIQIARELYQTDDIEIDDDALQSASDDGQWISAWVWISKHDEHVCDDECRSNGCSDRF